MATLDSQPQPVIEPEVSLPSKFGNAKAEARRIKRRVTSKEGWVGDYDYSWYVCFVSVLQAGSE